MSSSLLKKYLVILNEATSIKTLQDAGPEYSTGDTQIWFSKREFTHNMMRGYDILKANNRLPDPTKLNNTHVLVGNVAEKNLDNIFSMMQSEAWNKQGQADALIQRLGIGHSNMSVGDIIVIGKKVLMREKQGYTDLVTGEKNIMLLNDIFESAFADQVKGTEKAKSAGKDHPFKGRLVGEADTNPTDKITMDIPLFIRMMEYAREDAKTDMDLHNVTERAIQLMQKHEHLCMQNYDELVGQQDQVPEGKIKGADGKACWDGYRYNGTKNGKDSCVKVRK